MHSVRFAGSAFAGITIRLENDIARHLQSETCSPIKWDIVRALQSDLTNIRNLLQTHNSLIEGIKADQRKISHGEFLFPEDPTDSCTESLLLKNARLIEVTQKLSAIYNRELYLIRRDLEQDLDKLEPAIFCLEEKAKEQAQGYEQQNPKVAELIGDLKTRRNQISQELLHINIQLLTHGKD